MVDSLTQSDIDRIFERLEDEIDLTAVKSKEELFNRIKDADKTRHWNRNINTLMWEIKRARTQIKEETKLELPAVPREKMTSQEKRRETIAEKKNLIKVKGHVGQKGYKRHIGRKWGEAEVSLVKIFVKDGLTNGQIGDQLKRTSSSVATKISRLGIARI